MQNTISRQLSTLFIIGVLGLSYSCKSNSVAKSEAKANNLAKLETLLVQNDYDIAIEVAYPFVTTATQQVVNSFLLQNTGNNASRVDIRGDGNFIKIENDSIKGYLPFFGERRLNGGQFGGTNSAIQFGTALTDLKKHIDAKKGKMILEFTTKQKQGSDFYEVKLEIFPNKHVMVDITPSFRTFMRYSGVLKSKAAVE